MEQIAKLLFAATILTIFVYLLFFYSIGYAGNGGEYWGFDGYIEPWKAAQDSFEHNETRFLEINLLDANGNLVQYVPLIPACENHPFGGQNFSRPSITEPLHGLDSIRLATEFARRFNSSMASNLEVELGIRCQVFLDK